MKEFFDFLNYYKDAFASLASIATVIALIVAGIWTYRIFLGKRTKYDHVEITHEVAHSTIDANRVLLRVIMNVHNKGESLLKIRSGTIWVQQMDPWPEEVLENIVARQTGLVDADSNDLLYIDWPLLGEKHIGKGHEYQEIESAVVAQI